MSLIAWQATIQDDAGNAIDGPTLTVRRALDNQLAEIFEANGDAKANPFTGSSRGFVQFYADRGRYTIQGTSGGFSTQVWTVDLVGVDSIQPIAAGGTGANTVADARVALELGTAALLNETATGSALVTAVDAAAGRTTLELGTAATAAVTTSATDSTAGRLLRVGDSATLLSASPALRVTYGGTADAIALTTGAGISGTPPTGLAVRFRATAANTGATTIALDGGSPIACRTVDGNALPAGYIRTGGAEDGYVETEAVFNGTYWVVRPSEPRLPGEFLALTIASVNTTSNGYVTSETIPAPRPGLWLINVVAGCLASTVGRVRVARDDDPIVDTITADPGVDNYSPTLFREGFMRLSGQDLLVQTGRNSSVGGTANLRQIRVFGAWVGH
jgi:hypothetical protein